MEEEIGPVDVIAASVAYDIEQGANSVDFEPEVVEGEIVSEEPAEEEPAFLQE